MAKRTPKYDILPRWPDYPDQAYQELQIEKMGELVPYTFDHQFLSIVQNRKHFKKERESLPGAVQVYLDGVYEGRYPYLDHTLYNKILNNSLPSPNKEVVFGLLHPIQKEWLINLAIQELSRDFTDDELEKHAGTGISSYFKGYIKDHGEVREEHRTTEFRLARSRIRRRIEEIKKGRLLFDGGFVPNTFLERIWLAHCWGMMLKWVEPIGAFQWRRWTIHRGGDFAWSVKSLTPQEVIRAAYQNDKRFYAEAEYRTPEDRKFVFLAIENKL